MERNWITQGIVLKTYPIGENHLGCLIATPNRGNVQVILHGGASSKGKLRRGAEILSEHTFYLYEDPQKSSIKVTDLDNSFQLDKLRNSLIGYTCAILGAEMLIHLHTEGSPEVYGLFSGLLDNLEKVEISQLENQEQNNLRRKQDDQSKFQSDLTNTRYKKVLNSLSITSVFLWKLMDLVGILPDVFACIDSGDPLEDHGTHYYSHSKSGFVNLSPRSLEMTDDLSSWKSTLIPLGYPGIIVVRWILDQSFQRAMVEPLPDTIVPSLTLMAAEIIEHFMGRKLKSLEMLRGLM